MKHSHPIFPLCDHTDITMDDVRAVSKGIAEENKHSPHMIPESVDSLLSCVRNHGGIAIKNPEGDLAGFVKLSVLDGTSAIHEWGSLFVFPAFRWYGIGRSLIHAIAEKYSHLAMLAVTNVPAVIAINSAHSEQTEIQRLEIPKRLLEIIEGPQALLSDDRVFINATLKRKLENGDLT